MKQRLFQSRAESNLLTKLLFLLRWKITKLEVEMGMSRSMVMFKIMKEKAKEKEIKRRMKI